MAALTWASSRSISLTPVVVVPMPYHVSTYHGPECELLVDFDFVFEDEDAHFAGDEGVEVRMSANRIPPMAAAAITTAVMQTISLL